MSNKNKTVSFRVHEDAFEALQDIAEERDISLSAVFRDYVDMLVEHDGQVAVVPEHERGVGAAADGEQSFPPTVEVSTSFVREHERLELEADHLREQLEEYKAYVTQLRDQMDEDSDEVLLLDELDDVEDADDPYQIG
jgi:predicted transcriptional regulator